MSAFCVQRFVSLTAFIELWDAPRTQISSVSHTKTSLVGATVSIPITNGSLNLGTWQGRYFEPGPEA